MDITNQKAKKEKTNKFLDKEKSPSFIADVKTLKENLKIREILRTVKMNSSMRLKAPRGSKVMQNKDFNDNDDFEDVNSDDGLDSEPTSATNPLVINSSAVVVETDEDFVNNKEPLEPSNESDENVKTDIDIIVTSALHKSKSLSEGLEETGIQNTSEENSPVICLPPLDSPILRARDRKLSLDHTLLSKREGLSQSEADLNSIGKLPLERKSSFFRKKMDSFLKNTTEIFKRQSTSLAGKSSRVVRSGSTCSRMSVSMQSLNENEVYNGEYDADGEALDTYNEELRGSVTSLRSSATPVRSNSSVSVSHSDRVPDQSEEDFRQRLQTLPDMSSMNSNYLSENYTQASFLHSRAISMSSGLDTAHGPRKRKTSRANRVTWVASESLTDYFRRLIQDEKTKEVQVSHSYQDFSTIPEKNLRGSPKTDSKGRRLSYQRAVSGEDPVLPTRYQDNSFRRRKIAETSENLKEISRLLEHFSNSDGIPPLAGYEPIAINDSAKCLLMWAEKEATVNANCPPFEISHRDEVKQAVLKELIHTEAVYISHLRYIVEVYLAAAHALQDHEFMLVLNTRSLFLNIPDILNANMKFWELVINPMIEDSMKNQYTLNSDLMAEGFAQFGEIMKPYEVYVSEQPNAVIYLREVMSYPEVSAYIKWCDSQNVETKLKISDFLVKPMQRLTRYRILLERINSNTDNSPSKELINKMEEAVSTFVIAVNRAMRNMAEKEKVLELDKSLYSFDINYKDEELKRYFSMYNEMNIRCQMVNCLPHISRAIIYEGDVRYKDNSKEIEVRAILLTDMFIICKKLNTGLKMIRPKISVENMACHFRYGSRHEITGLIVVVLNDHRVSTSVFVISEMPKDPNPEQTIQVWDSKIREAKIAYELSIWFSKYPVKDLSEIEADYKTEEYKKANPGSWAIEMSARELVAAMMHPYTTPSPVPGTDCPSEPGRGPPVLHSLHRASTEDSSRNSRLSSFQYSRLYRSVNRDEGNEFHSFSERMKRRSETLRTNWSAASHDDPYNGLRYLYKAGSSVEHLIPPQNPDDVTRSITVNVVADGSATVVPSPCITPPVLLVVQQPSPNESLSPRSVSAGGSQNTLQICPRESFVQLSMPNLNADATVLKKIPPPKSFESASEKLYRSHEELLEQHRVAASQQQYLSPGHRGTSYPPPSPTRGPLKRGLAFSSSFKYPPLTKMGHVSSQSQHNIDQVHLHTSTGQIQKKQHSLHDPSTSAGPSTEKTDKKKSLLSSLTHRSSICRTIAQFVRSKAGKKASPSEVADDETVALLKSPTLDTLKKTTKSKKDSGGKKKSSRQDKE